MLQDNSHGAADMLAVHKKYKSCYHMGTLTFTVQLFSDILDGVLLPSSHTLFFLFLCLFLNHTYWDLMPY